MPAFFNYHTLYHVHKSACTYIQKNKKTGSEVLFPCIDEQPNDDKGLEIVSCGGGRLRVPLMSSHKTTWALKL